MARKLTPAKVARIKADRAKGSRVEDLARKHDLSVGSISNALKAPSKKTAPVPAPAEPAALPPVTTEELRGFLSAQIHGLRADVTNSEDPSARAAANRNLLVATQLLSRIMPPAPVDESVGVLIARGELDEAAARVRERLHARLDAIYREHPLGAPCAACGRSAPMPAKVGP